MAFGLKRKWVVKKVAGLICCLMSPSSGKEGKLEDLSDITAEISEADFNDSEGVYDLINQCYNKAKGSSRELATDLGYTNSVGSVFLSYNEGQAKMNVGNDLFVSVSLEQMRRYLGDK